MRTISAGLLAAQNNKAVKPLMKVKFQRSLTYDSDNLVDQSPSWALDGQSISQEPIPQAVFSYNGQVIGVSNVFIGGVWRLIVQVGANTFQPTLDNQLPFSKPSLINGYLFYTTSAGTIRRANVDMGLLLVRNVNCLSNHVTVASGYSTSVLHAMSSIWVIALSLHEGGVRVDSFMTSSWTRYRWDGRFMMPRMVADDPYIPIYSAVAQVGNNAYVYQTDWSTGAVRGVKIRGGTAFGDSFEVIPSDLTRFYVANAFTANGYVHLVGQFERTGDLSISRTRNFVLRSTDGENFAFDSFSVFSNYGYRFLGGINGGQFFGYASGRRITMNATYLFTETPVDEVEFENVLTINQSLASDAGSFQIAIPAGNEQIFGDTLMEEHPIIRQGSRAIVYLGYETSTGPEYVEHMHCIVEGVDTDFGDGVREFVVSLLPEGYWKIQTSNAPYYVELQGKQAVYDACETLENLYVAPGSRGERLDRVSVDFWDSEPWSTYGVVGINLMNQGGPGPVSLGGTHNVGAMSADIKEHLGLSGYPVVTGPVGVKLYCWSRTFSGNVGDIFAVYLRVRDPETNAVYDRIGTLQSDKAIPPVTYASPASGYYPIEYLFNPTVGFEVGYEIQRVIVTIKGADTVSYLERVDLTGILAFVAGSENTPWKVDTVEPPEEQTLFKSGTAAKAITLWNGSGNDPVPLGWFGNEFDDSGWGNAVVNTSPPEFFDSQSIAAEVYNVGNPSGNGEENLIRQEFVLPAGRIVNALLTVRVEDYLIEGYINGNHFDTMTDPAPGSAYNASATVVTDLLTPDAPNVIALRIRADSDAALGVNYRLVVIYVPVGQTTNKMHMTLSNVPQIMFSQKPWSAYNFDAIARFQYDLGESGVPSTDVSYGLVGMAEDAQNLILGAYNRSIQRLEIYKFRDGVITNLASSGVIELPNDVRLKFSHRDGRFILSYFSAGKVWVDHLTYEWKSADGPMATGEFYHVGIWGYRITRHFRIASFNRADCEGVVPLPGQNLSFWNSLPSSGMIRIDGALYKYSGRTSYRDVQGPFQGRGTVASGSMLGWDVTWFDYDNPTSEIAGYLMASDNGHAHAIASSQWQILDRSRHLGGEISGDYIGLSTRMYVGPALLVSEGEEMGHSYGAVAHLESTDSLKVKEFSAASGEKIVSIADMLAKICALSGTKAEFPGDAKPSVVAMNGRTPLV